jgi:hypothetical protein
MFLKSSFSAESWESSPLAGCPQLVKDDFVFGYCFAIDTRCASMTVGTLDCFAFARNDGERVISPRSSWNDDGKAILLHSDRNEDKKEKTEFLRQWNLLQVRLKITANGERRTANGNTDIK